MHRTRVAYGLIALLALGGLFWWLSPEEPTQVDPAATVSHTQGSESSPSVDSSPEPPRNASADGESAPEDANSPPAETRPTTSGHAYSENEIQQVEAWYREHGYFLDDGRANYEAYDEDTLRELAHQNDLLAIQMLAQRAHRAGERNAAARHYMRAAALGSIRDLDQLSSMYFANYRRAREADDAELQRQSKIQLFAFNQVMEKRGYRMAARDSELYQERLGMGLNAQEQQAVEEAAGAIYRRLTQLRREMGLGEFDNRLPPLIEEHFERALEGPGRS